MLVPDTLQHRARSAGTWLVLLVVLVFCGEALGYVACLLGGTMPPQPAAWAVFVAVAIVVGALATLLLHALVLRADRHSPGEVERLRQQAARQNDLELALAYRIEQQRKLRHDIRGVLSPVLLIADRLLNHADPAIKRSGEIMVRTVDRATALLSDGGDAPANPPADP